MGQRAFRGDEICADAFSLRNLKRDLCKRKLFKVKIIAFHLPGSQSKARSKSELTKAV